MHWLCSMTQTQARLLNCSSWCWSFAALLHWLEQSGPLCLSVKQVCSYFAECRRHAEMCWSILARGLPMWQHVV